MVLLKHPGVAFSAAGVVGLVLSLVLMALPAEWQL
jgi:hypothetical protein